MHCLTLCNLLLEYDTMTAEQLIDHLKQFPPETFVYIWIDGERLDIDEIDDCFVNDGFLDLTVKVTA